MSEKFQNKYRIPSARAYWWDYGANAPYFITICTNKRIHYFGKVINGEMHLSAIGKFAQQCWNEIPPHFPFVLLDEFVVMPNHIHGIIIINKPDPENANVALSNHIPTAPVQTQNFASSHDIAPPGGNETQNFASVREIVAIRKTNLGRNRKTYHLSFVDLKLA